MVCGLLYRGEEGVKKGSLERRILGLAEALFTSLGHHQPQPSPASAIISLAHHQPQPEDRRRQARQRSPTTTSPPVRYITLPYIPTFNPPVRYITLFTVYGPPVRFCTFLTNFPPVRYFTIPYAYTIHLSGTSPYLQPSCQVLYLTNFLPVRYFTLPYACTIHLSGT